MQNYLALHRHAAVRTTLLDHQGIALRLAIAQIIAGSNLWSVTAEPQRANTAAITESLGANAAEDRFAEERATIADLLSFPDQGRDGTDDHEPTIVPHKHDWQQRRDLTGIFAKLLGMDDGRSLAA